VLVYQNLEVRINDMMNQKRLTPKDALDALASYAIAEEGTNTLFIGLVETMCQRDTIEQEYSL
jgi:hypothetical protein